MQMVENIACKTVKMIEKWWNFTNRLQFKKILRIHSWQSLNLSLLVSSAEVLLTTVVALRFSQATDFFVCVSTPVRDLT